jgi:hypothetical protein
VRISARADPHETKTLTPRLMGFLLGVEYNSRDRSEKSSNITT